MWSIALRMNHHLPPSMRFSVDETQGHCLHLTQILDADQLSLETLALAVTDASEIMQIALATGIYDREVSGGSDLGISLPAHLIRG